MQKFYFVNTFNKEFDECERESFTNKAQALKYARDLARKMTSTRLQKEGATVWEITVDIEKNEILAKILLEASKFLNFYYRYYEKITNKKLVKRFEAPIK